MAMASAMASAIVLSLLLFLSFFFFLLLLLFTCFTQAVAMAMAVASPGRNDCPPPSNRREQRRRPPAWTPACWYYCPRAPCRWQLLFHLLLPWLVLLPLCMPCTRASGHGALLKEMSFHPSPEGANLQGMGFCVEEPVSPPPKNLEPERNEACSIRFPVNASSSFACRSFRVSDFPLRFVRTSWNCVGKGRLYACAPVQCSCIQACASPEWTRPTGEEAGIVSIHKERLWDEISKKERKMEVAPCEDPVNGPGFPIKEAYGLVESEYSFSSPREEEEEPCGRPENTPSSLNPSKASRSELAEEHSKVNLQNRAGLEAQTRLKAFEQCLCSSSQFQNCFNLLPPRCTDKRLIDDIGESHLLSFYDLFKESCRANCKQFWATGCVPCGLDMITERENECAVNLQHRLLANAFLTCPEVLNISDEHYDHFLLNENKCISSIKKGTANCGKWGCENPYLAIFCPLRGSTEAFLPSFHRLRKLTGKVSLITALLVLAMLTKTIKQDKHLAMDFRLWFSCSYTVFLQSVYLRNDALRADEKGINQEKVLHYQNDQLSPLKNETCRQSFPVVMGRVVASIGYVFRQFLDSQDTMLNVRVQIAENSELKARSIDSNHCDILMDNVTKSLSTPVERMEGLFSSISGDPLSNQSTSVCVREQEEVNSFHLDPPIILEDIVEKPLSIKTLDTSEACESQAKEKKERRKRRKQRSNIIDLKKESERDSISGSSSPSSPASPATPLPCPGNSPFSHCNPSSNSSKTSANHTSRSQDSRNSFARLRSNEPLLQLDVHGHHVCTPFNKDKIYHLHYLTSKANNAKHTSKVSQTASTKAAGSGMVNKGNRNDKIGTTNTGENWAAVARRAAPKPEADQIEKIRDPAIVVKSEAPLVKKPVLLPSATFPQGGRSTQWRPQLLDDKLPVFDDPTSLSPSLVSTSLVSPDARAPGSRLARNADGKQLLAALDKPNNENGLDLRIHHRDTKKTGDVFLYDIWGHHFSEISRGSRVCPNNPDGYSSCDVNSAAESFFASPDYMVHITGITESSPPSSFSIFSRDTIFSQAPPADDAASSSFSPDEL